MKVTTVLNNIEKLINGLDYKSVYIEIQVSNNKYTLEKDNKRPIGFKEKQNS